jgi:excisionase family DNA binding protein
MRTTITHRIPKDPPLDVTAAEAAADETGRPDTPANTLAVSVQDGSKITNLGRSTLYELMAGGELPYVQIRGRRVLLVDDLAALLRRHHRTAASR